MRAFQAKKIGTKLVPTDTGRKESIRESFGNNILTFVLFQGDVAGNIWEDEPSIEITKISAREDVDNVLFRLAEEIDA